MTRMDVVCLGDLAGEPMVRLQRDVNSNTHDEFVQAFAAQGITPEIMLEASSDASMLNLVEAGLGVGIVIGAQRGGGRQGLILRRIEDLAASKQFVLAWNGDKRSGPLATLLALAGGVADMTVETQFA